VFTLNTVGKFRWIASLLIRNELTFLIVLSSLMWVGYTSADM